MVLNRPSQLLQLRDLRMILHTMRKVKCLLRHSEENTDEEESIIDELFEEKVKLVRDLFTSCE